MYRSPGTIFWMKEFPDQEVPIKTLFSFDMPMPTDKIMETMHPSNLEIRKKWDRAFLDHEMLESYPDGGYVIASKIKVSWPLYDRSFILFQPPAKEVDWFGKNAFLVLQKNAWHLSKPAGADGSVRATNGGNFTLTFPDEQDPTGASKMFGLRNNNYNGNLPSTGRFMRFVLSKKIPNAFSLYRENIIEGYNKYFNNND